MKLAIKELTREEQVAAVRRKRLDWRTATIGASVWIPYRGAWLPARIESLGRTCVRVMVMGHKKGSFVHYPNLRVRWACLDGADIPEEVPGGSVQD